MLSGSFGPSYPAWEFCRRDSLAGHWTLIDPISHRPIYYVFAPREKDGALSTEIRRRSADGPLVASISLQSSPPRCLVAFADDDHHNIELKPNFRGRHRFTVDSKHLYWKRDVVCRESRTRHVYAETKDTALFIHGTDEKFADVIIATFVALRLKAQNTKRRRYSCF